MPINLGEIQAEMTLDKGDFDRGLKTSRKALSNLGVAAGAAAAAVASAMAAIGTKSVQATAQFEQAITEAGIKVQATSDTLERLEEAAIEAGKATKFTATESANALTFLGQAGFSASEQIEALPGVLELAAAENMNVARTADIASNILQGFGKDTSELADINDLLVKTSQSANTNVAELGQAMSFAAPAARSMGVSVSEAAAVVGQLSNAGIKAGRAGRGLRTVLAKMPEVARELGTTLSSSEVASLGLAGSLQKLQKAGLDSDNALEQFGRRHGVVVQSILQEGIPALQDLTKEVRDNANAAGKAADKQLDTLSGKFEQLKGSVNVAAIALGEELKPTVEDITDITRSMANQVAEADSAWAELISTVSNFSFKGIGLTAIGTLEALGLDEEGTTAQLLDRVKQLEKRKATAAELGLPEDASPGDIAAARGNRFRARTAAKNERRRRKLLRAQAPGLAGVAPGVTAAPGEGQQTQMAGTVFRKTTEKQIQSLEDVNKSLDQLDKSVKKDVKASKKQREALIEEINQGENTRRAVEARKRLMRKGRQAAGAVLGGVTGPKLTAQAKSLKAKNQFRNFVNQVASSAEFKVMKDAGKTLLVAGQKLDKAGDKQKINADRQSGIGFNKALGKARGVASLLGRLSQATGTGGEAIGAISGALSGAGTGFSVGGIPGAAIGGGVGLLSSLIGGDETAKQKQRARQRREQRKQIKRFANRTAERLADEMEERQLQARVIRIDASGALVGSKREVSSRLGDLLENEVGRREGFNI